MTRAEYEETRDCWYGKMTLLGALRVRAPRRSVFAARFPFGRAESTRHFIRRITFVVDGGCVRVLRAFSTSAGRQTSSGESPLPSPTSGYTSGTLHTQYMRINISSVSRRELRGERRDVCGECGAMVSPTGGASGPYAPVKYARSSTLSSSWVGACLRACGCLCTHTIGHCGHWVNRRERVRRTSVRCARLPHKIHTHTRTLSNQLVTIQCQWEITWPLELGRSCFPPHQARFHRPAY